MLDRLEGAFVAQRAFLDDAGHELRTPITVVRGNIELLDTADASDVEGVRALVLDELDRMTRLVDELTLLAKAQRPDFVRTGPVDLGSLTDEIEARLPTLGDRRWSVDERPTESSWLTVSGSPRRSSSSRPTRSVRPGRVPRSLSGRASIRQSGTSWSGCGTPAPAWRRRIATGSSTASPGGPTPTVATGPASVWPS